MKKKTPRISYKTLCSRGNRAGGMCFGIERMVDEKRSPEEILIHLLAIKGSIESLIYKHFIHLISRHLDKRLEEVLTHEDLHSELQDYIAEVRKKKRHYEIKDLSKVFYDLKQFEKRLGC